MQNRKKNTHATLTDRATHTQNRKHIFFYVFAILLAHYDLGNSSSFRVTYYVAKTTMMKICAQHIFGWKEGKNVSLMHQTDFVLMTCINEYVIRAASYAYSLA